MQSNSECVGSANVQKSAEYRATNNISNLKSNKNIYYIANCVTRPVCTNIRLFETAFASSGRKNKGEEGMGESEI